MIHRGNSDSESRISWKDEFSADIRGRSDAVFLTGSNRSSSSRSREISSSFLHRLT